MIGLRTSEQEIRREIRAGYIRFAAVAVLVVAFSTAIACWPSLAKAQAACMGFPLLGLCDHPGELVCFQPWYPSNDRVDCYRCLDGCWVHVVPGFWGTPDATITPYQTPTRTPTPVPRATVVPPRPRPTSRGAEVKSGR